ncbi:hypothetical protein NEDG_00711 [Nematocida displodere]|uniref:RRM domain-containing protein n=1 Tax=Nematocida displodere TaxID=1805483 RepID=A0A177ECM9_9MICR|nr:hypothetical protein NEDG_00711 [Nematocida displodere]
MMKVSSMISNFIIAVKIHKHTKRESESSYVIVEYAESSAAEKAVSETITLNDVPLDKDFAQSRESRGASTQSPNFKTKVYLGNLSEEFSEDNLKDSLRASQLAPKSMFVSAVTDKQKKYAFLEFADEAERNVALGEIEKMKQDGVFEHGVIVSPAYPYSQSKRSYKK